MQRHVKLIISGRVQGVFFRASTREKARQLNLDGWVKNLPGGRVATLASGEVNAIREFIDWCHQGPEQAIVDQVKITEVTETPEYKGFIII